MTVFELIDVLRALRRTGLVSCREVRDPIDDIESKDRVVVTRKEEIFAED